MIGNVLVVCHANRWRSPLAQALLVHYGAEAVASAGFKEAGRPAAKPIRDYAARRGLTLESHRSAVVDEAMINWADVVLYMDSGNLRRLIAVNVFDVRKFRCLADFGGALRVPDPAFLKPGSDEFLAVMDLIDRSCRTFCEREE